MNTQLTIGITTYNARETILTAIESALSQSLTAREVIIVDDASTDGTREVLEQAQQEHGERIRLIYLTDNVGVAAARNQIIDAAQGEFLAFFDDDDVSQPERCMRQIVRIKDYEAAYVLDDVPVICHTAREQHYPDGTVRIEHTMGEVENSLAPHGVAVAMRILRGDPLENAYGSAATCSQMARLDTYRKLKGFDPEFRRSEDTEFNIRLAIAGGHFVGIAEPLVKQTMSATTDKPISAELNYGLAILEKHRGLFSSDAEYRFCRSWLKVKNSWLRRARLEFVIRFIRVCLRHPWLTLHRARMSLPNLAGNHAVSRLHKA